MSPTCRSLREFVIVTGEASTITFDSWALFYTTPKKFDFELLTNIGEMSWRFELQLMVSVVSGV